MGRKSIVGQTAFRLSLVYGLVLIALCSAFTVYITTYMRDRILEGRAAGVETATGYMESSLEGMMHPVISLGEYVPTARLADGYYSKYTPRWMDNIRNLDAYLQNVSMFNRFVVDINLLNSKMETVYSMNDILRYDYAYGEQEWFTSALQQDAVIKCAAPHGSDHLYRYLKTPTFSLIYPIRKQDRETGYIVMEVDLLELAAFLKEKEDGISYILIDEAGREIYPDDPSAAEENENLKPAADPAFADGISADLTDESLPSRQIGNCRLMTREDSYYLIRKLKVNQWTVILKCSRQMIFRPVQHLLIWILGIGLATILLVTVIISRQVHRLARPMNTLVSRISTYNGSGSVPVDYQDAPAEVALIGEQFEVMADKLNTLIQKVYVAELQEKEARLEALLNQINPHFLYNVMQLIETKAVLSDNREIEDMIQALSQMMRYAMERGRDMVRIQEELTYIEHYLMFYQARFPNLCTCRIDCPEELLPEKMPKFILQPVVENCIRHGFDRVKGGGLIRIRIYRERNDIEFTIADNGSGIDEATLSMIRRRLSSEVAGSSIGIVNTNARIRLIYGEAYGLEIESMEGEGTTVTLRIAAGEENGHV